LGGHRKGSHYSEELLLSDANTLLFHSDSQAIERTIQRNGEVPIGNFFTLK
jgi:hypothetical protein